MGKWLAKFSGDSSESLPDITDTLPSVSGLSGPHLESLPEIACPETSTGSPESPIQAGWLITYRDQTNGCKAGTSTETMEPCSPLPMALMGGRSP